MRAEEIDPPWTGWLQVRNICAAFGLKKKEIAPSRLLPVSLILDPLVDSPGKLPPPCAARAYSPVDLQPGHVYFKQWKGGIYSINDASGVRLVPFRHLSFRQSVLQPSIFLRSRSLVIQYWRRQALAFI